MPPRKEMTWADRVSALVDKYKSPEALALAAGVSYLTVQRWRAGTHQPSHLAQHKLIELEKVKA
jgi:DNA-binding transcriptional regulator YiaG